MYILRYVPFKTKAAVQVTEIYRSNCQATKENCFHAINNAKYTYTYKRGIITCTQHPPSPLCKLNPIDITILNPANIIYFLGR